MNILILHLVAGLQKGVSCLINILFLINFETKCDDTKCNDTNLRNYLRKDLEEIYLRNHLLEIYLRNYSGLELIYHDREIPVFHFSRHIFSHLA